MSERGGGREGKMRKGGWRNEESNLSIKVVTCKSLPPPSSHSLSLSLGPNIYSLVSPVMMLAHIYCGLSSTPTVIKMCPPLTTKNWSFYKPLVAVGNGTGGVQIVNLSTRQLYREITVHTCSVRYDN